METSLKNNTIISKVLIPYHWNVAILFQNHPNLLPRDNYSDAKLAKKSGVSKEITKNQLFR